MAKSAVECIETNDFEEAKRRYEKAYVNWREHWFRTCEIIYNTCEKWKEKYIINTIDWTIFQISEMTKKPKSKQCGNSHSYIIKMFDIDNNWIFTKIGKADSVEDRMKGLTWKWYKKPSEILITRIEIVRTYDLPTDDLANVHESLMRNYFKRTKVFYPQDRFEPFEPNENDFNIFDQYYNMLINLN